MCIFFIFLTERRGAIIRSSQRALKRAILKDLNFALKYLLPSCLLFLSWEVLRVRNETRWWGACTPVKIRQSLLSSDFSVRHWWARKNRRMSLFWYFVLIGLERSERGKTSPHFLWILIYVISFEIEVVRSSLVIQYFRLAVKPFTIRSQSLTWSHFALLACVKSLNIRPCTVHSFSRTLSFEVPLSFHSLALNQFLPTAQHLFLLFYKSVLAES